MQVGELLDALKDVPRNAQVQIDVVCKEDATGAELHHGAVAGNICILDRVPGMGVVIVVNGPSKDHARHRIEGIVNYLDQ